jgi:diguanylate cyclase (GGDEF)-like protein
MDKRWENQEEIIEDYINKELMITKALRASMASDSPEESIEILLEYLGKALGSERVYIFETKDESNYDNTYEWCADGVTSEKENLQDVPYEALKIWIERFQKNKNVIIKDLEAEKENDPLAYEYLKPQNIHSLVASPLIDHDKIIGFYGVDNPPAKLLHNISTLFEIMGYFIVSMLRRRELLKKLEQLSYYDELTGCGNRHAMNEFIDTIKPDCSIGLIYGDVTGLKMINDLRGHHAGDLLLRRASECLRLAFPEYALFRIGGDEFVVLCPGISQVDFYNRISQFKLNMKENSVLMAIGAVWHSHSQHNIHKLLTQADERMYDDKRGHYSNMKTERGKY